MHPTRGILRYTRKAMDAGRATQAAKGHFSIAHVRDHWYIACRSRDLGDRPFSVTILGVPLVLFRGTEGKASALLDRCAHRNVPLSLGTVEESRLVCGYHGWAFDPDGVCQHVPALCGIQTGKARRVPTYAVVEQQGFVWIYGRAETAPEVQPFVFPAQDDPRYSSVDYHADFEGTLHATLENILDVPHTAYLHRGLFRGVKANEITAIVRRRGDQVEAEYVGEPRPTGLIGRILAPRGGTVTHFDRFILPSVAQVEYGLGERSHVYITSVLTPVSDFVTRLWSVATFRLPIPTPLIRAVLMPFARRVIAQDARMLRAQTESIRRFEGEQFVSTEVDLLGPHILRLLRQAERGEKQDRDAATTEERFQLIA